MNETKELEICERLTATEESCKSAHKRIDNIEKLTKSIYELTTSIKAMQKDISSMSDRLTDIEKIPKKRWDLVVTTLMTTLIGGLVGFLLSGVF